MEMISKNIFSRILVFVNLLLIVQLFGCAKTPVYPKEMPEWTRVAEKKGCLTYLPKRNEPHDINVELKPDTEKLLMSLLAERKLESPSCWYETPAGSLILRVGPLCETEKEAQFRKSESGWVLASFKEFLVFCHEKNKK